MQSVCHAAGFGKKTGIERKLAECAGEVLVSASALRQKGWRKQRTIRDGNGFEILEALFEKADILRVRIANV